MNFRIRISYWRIMRVSERGQITIPKQLRQRYGLTKDTDVEITPTDTGLLIRKRTNLHPVDASRGVLRKPSSSDEYLNEIRGG